jgi:hypothetical protein
VIIGQGMSTLQNGYRVLKGTWHILGDYQTISKTKADDLSQSSRHPH